MELVLELAKVPARAKALARESASAWALATAQMLAKATAKKLVEGLAVARGRKRAVVTALSLGEETTSQATVLGGLGAWACAWQWGRERVKTMELGAAVTTAAAMGFASDKSKVSRRANITAPAMGHAKVPNRTGISLSANESIATSKREEERR